MKELVLYHCRLCGRIICMVNDTGVIPQCCGEAMSRIVAHTSDSGKEKHVPVIRKSSCENACGFRVFVGESPHPMSREHYIEWIALLTDRGLYVRTTRPEDPPEAGFTVCPGEDVIAAYAFCNLHGLWMSEASHEK